MAKTKLVKKHKLNYRVTTTGNATMLQELLNYAEWQLLDVLVLNGGYTVIQVRFVEVEV